MRTNGGSPTFHVMALATCTVLCLGLIALLPGVATAQDAMRTTETCLGCHDGQAANLVGSPHQITALTDAAGARIACTDCHKGPASHWEDDPESNPMGNPATVSADAAAKLCAGCHVNPHQQSMMTGDPHNTAGVSCTSCHQVHGGANRADLLKQPEPGLCYSCHGAVQGQFAQPSRHPVADGVMTCSDCHLKSADARGALTWSGTNAMCVSCHDQFQGPFPFEHQATMDFSTEEGGCLSCHDPHGSALPRLLKQPYESPHYNLCTQCHAVPKHNFNQEHGTAWAGVACTECHVDVHGSYENRLFLTPALRAQGCSAVGCHHF